MTDAPRGKTRPDAEADTDTDLVAEAGVDLSTGGDLSDLADDAFDPLAPPTGWGHSRGFLFGEMLLFAILSLVASFILAWDALKIAENPGVYLSCNINEVFNCSKVALSDQAHVFGFPNAFFGLVAEPVVMTIAVAGLAKVRFPRWFLFTANAVYLLGVIFAYWLLYQSTFVIHALCPWCLVVTLSTTFVFVSMLHWNIVEGNLYLSPKWQERALSFVRSGSLTIILAVWILAVIGFELFRWRDQLFG